MKPVKQLISEIENLESYNMAVKLLSKELKPVHNVSIVNDSIKLLIVTTLDHIMKNVNEKMLKILNNYPTTNG